MKIGIIVAMDKELRQLQQLFDSSHVRVEKCGIGKVNAALGAQRMINEFHPDCIISSGCAGGNGDDVNIQDVVVSSELCYHDVYCGTAIDNTTIYGQVQGLPLYFEGSKRLLDLLPHRDDLHCGLICSGDQFIDTMEDVQRIKGNFPEALAVDMESGAIAQVCHLNKVPFLALRVISDSPGASHDNTKQYLDFWSAAPRETFNIVKDIINNLK